METETNPSNRRILLIDDNEAIHHDFQKILNPAMPGKAGMESAAAELFGAAASETAEAGFEIDSAYQGQEGLGRVLEARAAGRPYAMAFVDLRMPPGWDGIETISRIWSEDPDLQIVICTAYSDYSLDQIVAKLGRSDKLLILKKPFDAIEARQLADALTEKWRLAREARAKMDVLEERVAERTRELRERQQELIEARKLELVGKLAGGIAHDFNTLLTVIIGHAEMIRQSAPADSQAFLGAIEIGHSAMNAAKLTHQLLSFSRKQMLKIERVDINETIRRIGPEVRKLMGSGIEVITVAGAKDEWAMIDAGQLDQVLLSIADNALDAMPKGGKLIIETADAVLTQGDRALDRETLPGDYLLVSIKDTGIGISDEVREHLFEPFFTTKALGEGKGLGLAVCYGLLKQMGGCISVESEAGKGATFKVYLPRTREVRPKAVQAPAAPALSSERGTEVILLVEENVALRELAGTVLEQKGYTVRRAANGREAMSLAGAEDQIDLLLADAVLAEMTGPELAEWLAASRPAMKVLLTSGSGGIMPRGEKAAGGLLMKPYTPGALSRKVRETLDGAEVLCAV